MFESFARGFRMIWASIKMGWADKRLLLPSILIVFTNIFFGSVILIAESQKVTQQGPQMLKQVVNPMGGGMGMGMGAAQPAAAGPPTHGLLGNQPANMKRMMHMTAVNGPGDQGGFAAMGGQAAGGLATPDNVMLVTALGMIWWLTNRFLEGVTTGLVYSHLTEGKGSGKFSEACKAVFSSLPAIVMLGLVTFIAKKLASWLRNKRNSGMLGMGFNFLAGVVEVFWTLAGHLILPAIVIEGCSFWGGLKRADKIAQGNLLTIGVGEVGVEVICNVSTGVLYGIGLAGMGAAYYFQMMTPAIVAIGLVWAAMVVGATALSIYIRSAFYTCLYVWAIEAEAVEESERVRVKPPEPLAMALA